MWFATVEPRKEQGRSFNNQTLEVRSVRFWKEQWSAILTSAKVLFTAQWSNSARKSLKRFKLVTVITVNHYFNEYEHFTQASRAKTRQEAIQRVVDMDQLTCRGVEVGRLTILKTLSNGQTFFAACSQIFASTPSSRVAVI